MCELFGMSSRAPVSVRYELNAFAAEGGERHCNRDGWGLMFAESRDAHVFREAEPAANSALARMLVEREIPSRHLIGHVRRASRGQPLLANTHPFSRVRGGRVHHFAHNGTLTGIEQVPEAAALSRERVGDTDSELAFLLLLDRLDRSGGALNDANRFAIFTDFVAEMRHLGTANILFFDGQTLFIHSDLRRFEIHGEMSEPREPGLVMRHFGNRSRHSSWHGRGPELRGVHPETVLVASVPLDDERWDPLARGTTVALRDGALVARRHAD